MSDLRATIAEVRQSGRKRDIACPAHDDHRASLGVLPGREGRIILKCQAGCPVEQILDAVGLAMADLFERRNGSSKTIVATYDYIDLQGKPYQAVRYAPKDFRRRRPDGSGGWIWDLKEIRLALYRRAELQGQSVVYLVEGEEDVRAVVTLGLVATTSIGGAKGWRDEYARQLVDAGVQQVVILPDHDDAGRAYAQQAAQSCHAAGLAVTVVTLPDLPPKGDVSDWLAAGHTRDELVGLVKATPQYTPTPEAKPAKAEKASKPKAEKPKQGRDVHFDEPEPWPDPVQGAELLDAIADTFSKYIALPQHASSALALWVLHAFTFEAWFATPFLAVTSPEKRCGKTLLLIVLGALVPRRLFASNVTPAVLFRTIEKYAPTLLIDEADSFVRDNEELRGVLNSGHTRTTATVIRAVGDDHDPRAFSTWCAKAIALIGRLPGTLDDRAIEIRMRRRTPRERVERLRQDRIDAECHPSRRQAIRWATDHVDALAAADPHVPSALHDRAADCWRPLLAVADEAGGPWPRKAREAALALSDVVDEEAASTRLLRDIRDVFVDDENPDAMASSVILEKLIALEDRPWKEWSHGRPLSGAKLAHMLKGYDVQPAGSIRVGGKPARAYRRAAFEEAWDRYLSDDVPSRGGLEALQRDNVNESGAESPLSKRDTEDVRHVSQSVTNPMNTDDCHAVTDQDPREGELPRREPGDDDDDEQEVARDRF